MVTKAMFDEIKVLRGKVARLEAVEASKIGSTICTVLLKQYEKDLESMWDLVHLSFEGVDFYVVKVIELYYYRGLKVDEISEFLFRGTKTPTTVRKMITDFLIDLNIKNQHGLPPMSRSPKEQ